MLASAEEIKQGLEEALNVDRNSFRETDPHYIKLQEVVYRRLGGDKETKTAGIFSDISKYSRERNVTRRMKEEIQTRKEILADIEALLGVSFEIELCEDDSTVPVKVDMNSGKIFIYERHPIFPRARAARRIFERILIAYELANGVAESREAVHEEFYRLLMES